jgi:hypothetical protein
MAMTDDGRRAMGLFDRLRGGGRGRGRSGGNRRGTLDRGSHRGDLSHLEQFVASRRGVEGYVEPRTTVTETTIVLVAADGEWTRRRIDGPDVARKLSRDLGIPVYDAQVTGYPQRMRDWSARQKHNRLE